MKRILVTGAQGQLGSTFRLLSADRDEDWTFVDRQEMDLIDKSAVERFLAEAGPYDLILHTAAYTAVDRAESEVEVAQLINAEAPGILARYAREHDAVMVYYSTDYVYHNTLRRPLRESDITSPKSVYAQTKLQGEREVMDSGGTHYIFRTSWVFSPFGHNFVKTMLRLMAERDSLSVVADQLGTPTYTFVLAQVVLDRLDRLCSGVYPSGVYNLSNSDETTWHGFACAINDLSGLDCDIKAIPTSEYPTPAARPPYSVLDKSKIQATMDLHEIPHWRESLEDCLERLGR